MHALFISIILYMMVFFSYSVGDPAEQMVSMEHAAGGVESLVVDSKDGTQNELTLPLAEEPSAKKQVQDFDIENNNRNGQQQPEQMDDKNNQNFSESHVKEWVSNQEKRLLSIVNFLKDVLKNGTVTKKTDPRFIHEKMNELSQNMESIIIEQAHTSEMLFQKISVMYQLSKFLVYVIVEDNELTAPNYAEFLLAAGKEYVQDEPIDYIVKLQQQIVIQLNMLEKYIERLKFSATPRENFLSDISLTKKIIMGVIATGAAAFIFFKKRYNQLSNNFWKVDGRIVPNGERWKTAVRNRSEYLLQLQEITQECYMYGKNYRHPRYQEAIKELVNKLSNLPPELGHSPKASDIFASYYRDAIRKGDIAGMEFYVKECGVNPHTAAGVEAPTLFHLLHVNPDEVIQQLIVQGYSPKNYHTFIDFNGNTFMHYLAQLFCQNEIERTFSNSQIATYYGNQDHSSLFGIDNNNAEQNILHKDDYEYFRKTREKNSPHIVKALSQMVHVIKTEKDDEFCHKKNYDGKKVADILEQAAQHTDKNGTNKISEKLLKTINDCSIHSKQ